VTRLATSGLSTVEALVALALLGVVAASLAQGLAAATAARLRSSRQMQATHHALSIIEQLRSGDRDIAECAGLEGRWSMAPVPSMAGLSRFSVTVGVEGRDHVTLEGLSWQRP
jgi:type II secretory pathway pseudopilin PulG